MLPINKKEGILLKAGYVLPPFPSRRLPLEERYLMRNARVPQEQLDADEELAAAVADRRKVVEALYVKFTAERARKSSRGGDET